MQSDDPAAARERLDLLRLEHELAMSIGLDSDPVYMADLEQQLQTWEAAWVASAVTQIAVSRAVLQGRSHG